MKIIVTTSMKAKDDLRELASQEAASLQLAYQDRGKASIATLLKEVDGALVLGQDGWTLHHQQGQALSFHPDTAFLRYKAPRDPLLDLIGSQPKKIIDATLGLGSDAILMASGGHHVVGLEASPWIAFILSKGLVTYKTGHERFDAAMGTIQVHHGQALDYLMDQEDKSVDIVYFDPMFSQTIKDSHNLAGLYAFAEFSPLTSQVIDQAKRVAREKLILKAHFRDSRMETLGFSRIVRPYQKFHYGVLLLI